MKTNVLMLRVFTAFSGYDSQCLALNRANIDYELVGWSESDKIRHVVSKTQCYKLAGNSIVVDVLVAIFNQLFSENKTTDKQLKLF